MNRLLLQTIHMECEDFFSMKKKKGKKLKLKISSAAVVIGALRTNIAAAKNTDHLQMDSEE